jgi:very-short-patch-repair endonuclease
VRAFGALGEWEVRASNLHLWICSRIVQDVTNPWEVRAKYIGAAVPIATCDPGTPVARARQLRRRAGDAERLFWSRVRNRRLGGHKIRRQVPVGPFVADFVCVTARIIIELDGDQHAEAITYDEARTRYLEGQGYRVIRFATGEVLRNGAQVLSQVFATIEERLLALRCAAPSLTSHSPRARRMGPFSPGGREE